MPLVGLNDKPGGTGVAENRVVAFELPTAKLNGWLMNPTAVCGPASWAEIVG
jgi:alpha-D-ribose 1-methylphosphonate 5-triphosphate synthase subunit PhnH